MTCHALALFGNSKTMIYHDFRDFKKLKYAIQQGNRALLQNFITSCFRLEKGNLFSIILYMKSKYSDTDDFMGISVYIIKILRG